MSTKKSVVKTGSAVQADRKPMGLADARKIGDIEFETKVNIRQIYSKDNDKWYTLITLGQAQDKKFMVVARKDGKGTTLITDYTEYMRLEGAVRKPSEVAKI